MGEHKEEDWDDWDPLRDIRGAIQSFDNLLRRSADRTWPGIHGHIHPKSHPWAPVCDLGEDRKKMYVRCELPGVDKGNVSVEVKGNVLTVSGTTEADIKEKDEEHNWYVQERIVGQFARSLRLPRGVEPKSIQASFNNGILEVEIPKPAEMEEKEEESHKVDVN